MKNIYEVSVMLGGSFPKKIPKGKLWCGVDKGALYLIENNINPILSCGDFDSVEEKEKIQIKNNSQYFFEKHSQYLTDTDFSLRCIIKLFPSVKEINIYGATGNRLDHFFGNILLLNNNQYRNIVLKIIDDNNIITLAQKGKNIFIPKNDFKYFSIVPIYENTVITIKNAKYEAEDLKLTSHRPNATSNEFTDNKNIEINTNKNILVIYSRD
ncbi:thiamine diphosphokinase [Gemella cuniculi]|uniref:thiamine diphosphokinase n=1 Tax=Gemella cuniculi TaxID=150240 RepID=UPI00040B88CA|nr:thiamine diphosphokinase [Gemella cuniculi]